MFAHFAQETGNHNPSDKEYEEWRQVGDLIFNNIRQHFWGFLGLEKILQLTTSLTTNLN